MISIVVPLWRESHATVHQFTSEIKKYPHEIFWATEKGQDYATWKAVTRTRPDQPVFVMDIDGQNPTSLIPIMSIMLALGYNVIWPVRIADSNRTLIYRILAAIWYSFLYCVGVQPYASNFCALSPKARQKIVDYKGPCFFRGMIASAGPYAVIPYVQPKRSSGQTHYNQYWGSLKIVWAGIRYFIWRCGR